MIQTTMIGNLGADAKVETANGRQFLSFRVGDNRKWTDSDGTRHEETIWVSCTYSGKYEALLPYLKKGSMVCVMGRISTRIYSSEKERRMMAGLNMMVDRIELIGRKPEAVPSVLYDEYGVLHHVSKAYFINNEEAKALGVSDKDQKSVLQTLTGEQYLLSYGGWVSPISSQPAADDAGSATNNEDNNDAGA